MRIKRLYDHTVCIRIIGCEPQRMLNACALSGLALWNIRIVDENTISALSSEGDLPMITARAASAMCDVETEKVTVSTRRREKRSASFALALILALILSISSLFVWDIEIEGNSSVSNGQILRSLSKAGMDIGTFWPECDVEAMRGTMLLDNPDIEWLSVNVHASGVRVLVLEREKRPALNTDVEYADIVAGCDGIISSVSVLNGTGLVSKGQTVEKGELLISGTVRSTFGELELKAAQGSIIADTWRSKSTVMASNIRLKGAEKERKNLYALRLGKKRINFYRNSGNAIDGCVKIVSEYTVGVEGLFSLPLAIVREELVYCELGEDSFFDTAGAKDRLTEYLSGSVDGQIISAYFEENGNTLTLNAHCLENIAQSADRNTDTPKGDTYDRTGN